MNNDDRPFSSRQAAHALGISLKTLHTWRRSGFATPQWKMPQAKGAYLWAPDEIRRLLALGNGNRRVYKARRNKKGPQPVDGLIIVRPIPKRGYRSGL